MVSSLTMGDGVFSEGIRLNVLLCRHWWFATAFLTMSLAKELNGLLN
jgi:hypothetical protein